MVGRSAQLKDIMIDCTDSGSTAYHDMVRAMAAVVDAMPQPAAITRVHDNMPHLVAANSGFRSLWEDRKRASDPMMDRTVETILEQYSDILSGRVRQKETSFSFHNSLGLRSFQCFITRLCDDVDEEPLLLYTFFDRTDELRIEQVLRRELMTDALTALPNRAGFLELVDSGDEDRPPPKTILVIDLMRFSRINESLGPIAGDEIIITVARRIKSILRASDTLARVGGNEFAVHSTSVLDPAVAEQVAGRIRSALASPIRISSFSIHVEAAIGCAIDDRGAIEAEELFRRAQAAVKRAKRTGCFEVHRHNALIEAQHQFVIENRLREALDANALHLELQPFVSLATGQIEGFEALARWDDPELGRVSPGEFIPVAEESGLIVQLGTFALRESARILHDWDQRFGAPVPVTINFNLSPVQISRDDVPRTVREALQWARIDGSRLTVELTESALIADIDRTRALLGELKAMNLSIAMDDFGTGFSNLASLQTLPIDVLKIDRSFVTGMVGDADKAAIVRAILSLARALGMKTVAEGIETEEVGHALADLGCDRGQGYFYARPMAIDDAYAFWLERHSVASS